MIDLQGASRDELIRLIVRQHEEIGVLARTVGQMQEAHATLTAQVTQLTARVTALLVALDAATGGDDASAAGGGTPKGMPGHKASTPAPRPLTPRKQRTQAFVRHRMTPTAQVIHALDWCSRCGTPLTGGSVKRTREVIEVPRAPAVVTAHVSLERCCPGCRTRHTPAVPLGEAVVGKQRFGVGRVSLIATLREEGRWPIAMIQWYLSTLHGVRVSVGAITAALQQVARAGAGAVTAIREEMRASPVVQMDETGWREGGVNGYVWTTSTPTARYFIHGRRTAAMVDAILGEEFAGVVVSDFSAAYAHYPGVKQKCWAHLLRDVHALQEAHAKDAAVQAWAAGVHDVYQQAVAWTQAHPDARAPARQEAATRFARELQAVYAPWVEEKAPQRTLSAHGTAPARAVRVRSERAGARRQQRSGAEPARVPSGQHGDEQEDQRGHAQCGGQCDEDDACHPVRDMATTRSESTRRLPRAAPFPSSLNRYSWTARLASVRYL